MATRNCMVSNATARLPIANASFAVVFRRCMLQVLRMHCLCETIKLLLSVADMVAMQKYIRHRHRVNARSNLATVIFFTVFIICRYRVSVVFMCFFF